MSNRIRLHVNIIIVVSISRVLALETPIIRTGLLGLLLLRNGSCIFKSLLPGLMMHWSWLLVANGLDVIKDFALWSSSLLLLLKIILLLKLASKHGSIIRSLRLLRSLSQQLWSTKEALSEHARIRWVLSSCLLLTLAGRRRLHWWCLHLRLLLHLIELLILLLQKLQ